MQIQLINMQASEALCWRLGASLARSFTGLELDRMASDKKTQIRQNYAPWVTNDCKNEMSAREEAQAKAVNSGLDTDWEAFRAVRNSVTRMARKQKEKMQG